VHVYLLQEMDELLIANMASVTARRATSVSAVYSAAKKGDIGLLKLLLDNGAEVNTTIATVFGLFFGVCLYGYGFLCREQS